MAPNKTREAEASVLIETEAAVNQHSFLRIVFKVLWLSVQLYTTLARIPPPKRNHGRARTGRQNILGAVVEILRPNTQLYTNLARIPPQA